MRTKDKTLTMKAKDSQDINSEDKRQTGHSQPVYGCCNKFCPHNLTGERERERERGGRERERAMPQSMSLIVIFPKALRTRSSISRQALQDALIED